MIDRRIPGQSRDEVLSLFHSIFSGTENDILHSKGLSFCESDLLPIDTNKTMLFINDSGGHPDLRTKPHLVLDFDNAVAGFTLLRIYDVSEWNNELIQMSLLISIISKSLPGRLSPSALLPLLMQCH
jgi:hypothetical protein